MVLEKTLESPLDCKEIQPVHSEGDQPWDFFGRYDAKAKTLATSCEELDTTERLHFHFSLACIGQGNGNLLQCSCLENPRDRGAWWATVHGVAKSRT